MKHYKIVRLAGLHYKTPMLALYKNNPELKSQSYADQQKTLFQMGYVYSNSLSRGMRSLGHDAHEIVYDLEILQKTWAKEKGIKHDPDRWQYDIILKQIEDLRPEVVYFQDIHCLPHSIRKNLKQEFPFIKLIVVYKGFPGAFDELAHADALFVGSPTLVKQYKDAGLGAYLLYHAFDDTVLDKIGDDGHDEHGPKYDFTFVGSSGFGYGLGHQSRYWALVELIQRTNLELWVHDRLRKQSSYRIPAKARMKAQIRKSLKKLLEYPDVETLNKMLAPGLMPNKIRRLILEVIEQKREASKQNHCDTTKDEPRVPIKPLREMFPHRCHAPVFGIGMYRILRQSRVTFNRHTDAAEDSVGNMRMFQATGVGTCLLTDTGRNMADLFEEDHEVVTYSSIEECVEKANYLLEHDDVRRQIAAAGQRRTLKDHTVMNRCQQIDEILQKML